MAHPAFSNLFVETEFVPDVGALLATRRKQSDKETAVWAAHVVVVEGETVGDSAIRDGPRAVSRTRPRCPQPGFDHRWAAAFEYGGSVLDPVMSLRRTVRIPPGPRRASSFSTIVAPTREASAGPRRQVSRRHNLRAHPDAGLDAGAGATASPGHQPRRSAPVPKAGQRRAVLRRFTAAIFRCAQPQHAGRSALWAQGISGDLPIVLARIDEAEDFEIVRQLLRAHEYWRMKQLSADVVIINERSSSYAQELQGSLEASCAAAGCGSRRTRATCAAVFSCCGQI